MVSRADLTGARPVAPIEGSRPALPVGDPRQEAFARFAAHSIGKQFRAEIMSRLNDGSFVLKLADTAVRMNLPSGAQVGDKLHLTLIATQPRPTFLLGAPPDTADDQPTLSNAGRLIDRLLQAARQEGAPAALVGKTPLVPSPSASTEQVASALKNTLTYSGLFYESHVGQWASGERPLADLLREPQAKNSSPQLLAATLHIDSEVETVGVAEKALPEPAQPGQSDASNASRARAGMDMQGTQVTQGPVPDKQAKGELMPAAPRTPAASPEEDAAPGVAFKPAPQDPSTPAISREAVAPRAESMSSESIRMISLQLDTLEQQRVVWQGELWPGQPMEWEVTKDAPHQAIPDAERSWQSVVRFELPLLGAVAASIRLSGGRLQVQMRAAEENTAALLRDHGGELASALDAAGSPLDLMTVRRDDTVKGSRK